MGKFISCLWVTEKVEEMANFYLEAFTDTKRLETTYYVEGTYFKIGEILTISMRLGNHEFMLLNATPEFVQTPAVSYMVTCENKAEFCDLWGQLSRGGKILVPLTEQDGQYYGWLTDQYGTSWQLQENGSPQEVFPSFMFTGEAYGKASDAIQLWKETFGHFQDVYTVKSPDHAIAFSQFVLAGQTFAVMDNNDYPDFKFTMGNSTLYLCENQPEINRIWDKLTKDGKEAPCGWCEDPYGVVWQIEPKELDFWTSANNPLKAKAVTEALYLMKKIDRDVLEEIYNET